MPKKRKARITGGVLEYETSGSGRPAIVLINGAGVPMEGWGRVYEDIGKLGTVFAYNRFGVDGSDRPNTPQTGEAVITALRELLAAARP